jgi:hypothetical protein
MVTGARNVTRLGEVKGAYRVLVEDVSEENAFVKHRRIWEATVKIENGYCEKESCVGVYTKFD